MFFVEKIYSYMFLHADVVFCIWFLLNGMLVQKSMFYTVLGSDGMQTFLLSGECCTFCWARLIAKWNTQAIFQSGEYELIEETLID